MGAGERLVSRARRLRPKGFPWSAPTWPVSVDRAAPSRHLGADYDTEWTRRYPARLARAVLLDNVTRPLAHIVASPEVRGDEVLELVEAPAIYVANHASHIDTGLLLSVLPTRVRHKTVVAAAADHFFDRRWKAHVWSLVLAAIPIERHKVNRKSAEDTAALLRQGWNLIIFPEGGRTHDGWFQPMRGGAAYLSTRTGRPVVPVHIDGTYRIWPRGARRASPSAPPSGRLRVKMRASSRRGSTRCWRCWPTSLARIGGQHADAPEPGRHPRPGGLPHLPGAGRGLSGPTRTSVTTTRPAGRSHTTERSRRALR
jgi:1-acyl-sn-glycerol-3-phosphate acyltransferase